MSNPPKALYTAYFTGTAGNSIGLFFIGDGIIEGVDVGGLRYSGTYKVDEASKNLIGLVNFTVPPNVGLITGMTAGSTALTFPVEIMLPEGFADGRTVLIITPTGPVNASFEIARELQ